MSSKNIDMIWDFLKNEHDAFIIQLPVGSDLFNGVANFFELPYNDLDNLYTVLLAFVRGHVTVHYDNHKERQNGNPIRVIMDKPDIAFYRPLIINFVKDSEVPLISDKARQRLKANKIKFYTINPFEQSEVYNFLNCGKEWFDFKSL